MSQEKVIAINTVIIPSAQGIGFAIPINYRLNELRLVPEGAAKRPWLGIVGLSLNRQIAAYYDLPVDHGVLVTRVATEALHRPQEWLKGYIILQVTPGYKCCIFRFWLMLFRSSKVGEVIVALWNGREHFFYFEMK